jgi:uncharacterized protein (TIGR01244 family)
MLTRTLDDSTIVAGQLLASEMEELKAQGVTLIVNNRPDGEEPGQPTGAELEAAALGAGLGYRHIPVGSGGLSPHQVQAMTEMIEETQGRVLAFCRSGTRSTFLWALARARMGDEPGEIVRKAAAAGYDLTPILPHLR